VIEFTVNVTDPSVTGIEFNVLCRSEELLEFSNSAFIDIGTIYVNGVNYELFGNDASTALSVTEANISVGNFIDNTDGSFGIELDGFSASLEVRAPVEQGLNTIKIDGTTGNNQLFPGRRQTRSCSVTGRTR